MGCNQGKSIYDKISVENKEVSDFEKSWKLGNVPFESLELFVRRNCDAGLGRLIECFNEKFKTSLPLGIAETKLNSDDLVCLVILLGKGSKDDKLVALWNVHNKAMIEKVPSTQFSLLIASLMKISTLSIPIYLSMHASTLLQSFNQQLQERVEGLHAKLQSHFTGDLSEVSLPTFLSKASIMPQGHISNIAALRTQLEHTQSIPKRFSNPFVSMKLKRLDP